MAKTAAKAMTKSEIAAYLANQVEGLSKKQVIALLEAQSELALKQAKSTFTILGLGKVKLVDTKARMGRNPATGEQMMIKAKKKLKFLFSKAAKEAVLGPRK